MRLFSILFVSAAVVASCCVESVVAQGPSLQTRLAARRELELAKIDLRNYWQIDYPRQKRELDAAVEMAAKKAAGYFAPSGTPDGAELRRTKGRALDQ